MCFYLGHVFSHVFQESKSCLRLVKVLIGEIMRKPFIQNLQVCLPSCTINFLCPFNAATTRNRAAIKILSLFIVGLMVCLSYLWSRKASHKQADS